MSPRGLTAGPRVAALRPCPRSAPEHAPQQLRRPRRRVLPDPRLLLAQVGEEAPLLFQLDNEKWASRDLNDVGMQGDAHEGPHDPSPKYVKALQKKYPGMPHDIIPKRHK